MLPDFTASCTLALPTAASGLEYGSTTRALRQMLRWVINTGSNTNFFLGGLVHLDTDAGAAGDEVVPCGRWQLNSKLTVVADVGTVVRSIATARTGFCPVRGQRDFVPSFADQ